MFFDDLLDSTGGGLDIQNDGPVEENRHRLANAIVFKLATPDPDSLIPGGKECIGLCKPRLPYSNMVIEIDNCIVWCVTQTSGTTAGSLGASMIDGDAPPTYPKVGGFTVRGMLFERVRGSNEVSVSPGAGGVFYIDADDDLNIVGQGITWTKEIDTDVAKAAYAAYRARDTEKQLPAVALYIFIMHKLTSFLSCMNVRTQVNHPALKVQRKRLKHNKKPLHSYYTLELKKHGQSAKGRPQDRWLKRVHLCMGHERIYTPEAPLFGRVVGKIWVPAHVRGNRSKGMIHKRYSVKGGHA